MYSARPREIVLPFDPAKTANDARLQFIGHIESPWLKREDCPKNLRIARERGEPATVYVDEAWRQGLNGLEDYRHIILLYWMHEARRDIILQQPRHSLEPSGTFALRSPVRPNPIALATVELTGLDAENGFLHIDAIDCLNGTPLIDIKPWIATIDGAGT
ncbi:MAG: tRNA (N6-threonylcarbamoyladenosine(37)-N6)-methyltransferase TrmO [Rhizobiales bacterium]|nr:tRNA (N6-threonylcarbamoyladenosine(37)-N6)-methyltransferase TrmO [Hyphomicrobiales bacterium]